MLGKVLTVGITVFWVTMMALLTRREILPAYRMAREAEQTPGYAQLEAAAAKFPVSQMGIYLGSRRIGQTVARFRKKDNGFLITNETRIGLNLSPAGLFLPGGTGEINVVLRFKARVVEGQLNDFQLVATSPPSAEPLAIVDGNPIGDQLKLRIRQGGQVRTETMPFDAKQLLANAFGPMMTPSPLRVGMRWAVRTLDPTPPYALRTAWASVVRREPILVEGEERPAFLITIPFAAHEITAWADRDGRILKQKTFGFTFIREEPEPEAENSENP